MPKFKNIKITPIREKKKLGTAGSLLNAKKYLRREFFLLNGDTFFNFNILDLKKNFHLKKKICFAMALSINSKKRFTSISTEKKSNFLNNSKNNIDNFINAGFYYVSKKIFNFIDKDDFSLLIPSGFAHGFMCLSNNCVINYKCSNYRNKQSEKTLKWNDDNLNIKWPIKKPILSKKDNNGLSLSDFKKLKLKY